MTLSYPIWMLLGCQNDISTQYAERKATIEQPPSELAADWNPDIVLRLDYDRMSELAMAVLEKKIQELPAAKKEFLGFKARIKPTLTIKRLTISDAPKAEEVQVVSILEGQLKWSLGQKKGSEPIRIRLKTNAQVHTDNDELHLTINKIDSLSAKLSSVNINPLKSVDLGPWIEEWMGKQLQNIPPVKMGSITLPVRGIRLNSTPLSQNVEIRSNINHLKNIQTPSLALEHEWELLVHQETLLGWTQQKAFSLGIVGYGVAIDPVGLKVSEDAFEMALRLWKVEGRGLWWRDYTATGTLTQKKHKLSLSGESVIEGEKSPRAGLVDPLALIAESFILDGISEQLSQSLPTHKSTQMDGLKWKLQLDDWSATQDAVRLSGNIEVSKANNKANKNNTPNKEKDSKTDPSKSPKKR
jgi:hypothetical protein